LGEVAHSSCTLKLRSTEGFPHHHAKALSYYCITPYHSGRNATRVAVDGYHHGWCPPIFFFIHAPIIQVCLPPADLLHPDEQSNPYFSGGTGYPTRQKQELAFREFTEFVIMTKPRKSSATNHPRDDTRLPHKTRIYTHEE